MDKGALLIIGVGFMGGSLAKSLKKKGFQAPIYGLDINPNAIEKAKDLKVINEGWISYDKVPWDKIRMVIISTPVGVFKEIAKQLKKFINPSITVSDLGSTKRLVYQMEEIIGNNFVGAHPIAGTEKSGVEYAIDNLFEGKKLIITPTPKTSQEHLERVVNLWKFLGTEIEFMTPEIHDFIFGVVSHLPHAVAFALVDTLREMSTDSLDLFKYPGAGFKDFTRIAGSDPIMWRDIFIDNKDNVLKAIDNFINSLQRLKDLIEKEDKEKLKKYLEEISFIRRAMD
jgi:prephenate dehydrogenase